MQGVAEWIRIRGGIGIGQPRAIFPAGGEGRAVRRAFPVQAPPGQFVGVIG